jgi:3-oxoacyl-[acyl-carrier protein] reductase
MSRTAIITGASRGMGAAVAERLSKDGFSVVVNYAGKEAEASAVADKINAAGARAITVKAYVSSPAEVKRMFDLAEKSSAASMFW